MSLNLQEHLNNRIEVPSNWGGSDRGQGRIPDADKKKQVNIGIKQSDIAALGGVKACQAIMTTAIEASLNLLRQETTG